MRMIAAYHKEPALRYISHLDIQRTLHRALSRADLPVQYSAGFNPHPQMSFATALSTGMSGDAEWFDVTLYETVEPEEFTRRLNAVLPRGLFVSDAFCAPEGMGSLSALTRAASYDAVLTLDRPASKDAFEAALDTLLSGEIIADKRTKSGIKPVDIRPQILQVFVTGVEGNTVALQVLGRLQADGGLRMELFLHALTDRLDAHGDAVIHRSAVYFAGDGPLPRLPQD